MFLSFNRISHRFDIKNDRPERVEKPYICNKRMLVQGLISCPDRNRIYLLPEDMTHTIGLCLIILRIS